MWLEENDLKTRLLVLEKALSIEHFINQFLGLLLGIECTKSKTLGNKSTSLSLNQKVLILLDLKIIEPNEKGKIENFMSVRNQFMHNLKISTFEELFVNNENLRKWFIKNYPIENNSKTDEENYKVSFLKLSSDVNSIIFEKLLPSVLCKIKYDTKSTLDIKFKSYLEKIYFEIFETLPASLECFFKTGKTIENIEEFVNGLKEKFNYKLLDGLKEN